MKLKTVLAAFAAMVGLSAQAQTDAQYEAALATVANGNYGIAVEYNSKTYLVKANGYITDDATEAAVFDVSQNAATSQFKATEFRISSTGRFTNGGNSGSSNVIGSKYNLAVSSQNRTGWERQVLYLNDEGAYAVRSTNATSTAWAASAFWTVVDDNDADGLPNATYSMEDVDYIWKFVPEADLDAVKATVAAQRKARFISQIQAYIDDATYTEAKEDLSSAITEIEAATTPEEVHNVTASVATTIDAFLYANASETHPYNVTNRYIVTPTAVAHKALPNGWEGDTFGDSSDGVSEYWNKSSASFYQTVTLPAGVYDLSLEALTRDGMVATLAANEFSTSIATVLKATANDRAAAAAWFNSGKGINTVRFQLNEEKAVKISLTTSPTGVGTEATDAWTVWRTFSLTYYGIPADPFAIFKEDLQQTIDNARTEVAALAVPAGVKGVVTTLADEYENAYASYTEESQFTEAKAAINAAIATAQEAVSPTAFNALILGKANTTMTLAGLPSDATTTLQGVIDGNADALAACTNAAQIEAQTTVVWNAIAAAVEAIELTGDETLDLTYLMTNPDVTDCTNWQKADGWYTDQPDGNSQVMSNDAATSEDGSKTKFFEYWSNPAKANNAFTLYQKVTLPTGTYQISCYAFAQDQYAGQNSVGVYFYANDTQGSSVTTTRLSEASLKFINDAAQEVKIGLKAITGNTYNWMGIGYVTLTKVAENDTKYAINVNATNANVAVTVDDEPATEALALKTVTVNVTVEDGYTYSFAASYTAGSETVNLDVANPEAGVYTFQMPEYNVNITVVATVDKSALAAAIAAATITEGSVPTTIYTPYATALSNANAVNANADATPAEISAATTALTEATATATAAQTPYAAYVALDEYADALVSVANDNATANETLANAISTAATNVEAATDATVIENETVTLKDAMVTYAGAANPTGDGRFDLTFMLTNPDLTGMGNGPKDGWYTDQEQATQNSQAMTNNTAVANSEDNSKYAMYEYWSYNTEATDGFTVYQKVTLPEGTYQMNALAVAGWGWGASHENGTRNITFSANDIDGTQITTTTLEPATLDFVQTEAGEVKIGLKAHEGNQSNWMGIGYVTFYKVATKSVTIDENEDYTPESLAGTATLKRTFAADADTWNTFVVPFQITNEELKAAFGEGVAVAEFSDEGENEDAVTVNFTTMEAPAVQANQPVLIKGVTVNAANEYVFTNRTVAAGDVMKEGTFFNFVGTYAASMDVAVGDYFIGGNKLWKSTGATTIKGTRAYLHAKSAGVKAFLFIDGVATGIEAINGAVVAEDNAPVFNLAGQRVNKAQKGIYIQNGKKVLVK